MIQSLLRIAAFGAVILLSGCQTTSAPNAPGVFGFAPPPAEVTLNQSVRDALMNSGDPMVSQVRIDTNQAQVILSGYVKKIRQSDTAEMIARKVPGVQSVENRIIVRP
jgi:hypothetical protein